MTTTMWGTLAQHNPNKNHKHPTTQTHTRSGGNCTPAPKTKPQRQGELRPNTQTTTKTRKRSTQHPASPTHQHPKSPHLAGEHAAQHPTHHTNTGRLHPNTQTHENKGSIHPDTQHTRHKQGNIAPQHPTEPQAQGKAAPQHSKIHNNSEDIAPPTSKQHKHKGEKAPTPHTSQTQGIVAPLAQRTQKQIEGMHNELHTNTWEVCTRANSQNNPHTHTHKGDIAPQHPNKPPHQQGDTCTPTPTTTTTAREPYNQSPKTPRTKQGNIAPRHPKYHKNKNKGILHPNTQHAQTTGGNSRFRLHGGTTGKKQASVLYGHVTRGPYGARVPSYIVRMCGTPADVCPSYGRVSRDSRVKARYARRPTP